MSAVGSERVGSFSVALVTAKGMLAGMENRSVSSPLMGGQFWLAVGAVAATYGYFLLFAEFAFLELARATEPGEQALRGVMAALGVGGIAGSVVAWWRFEPGRWARELAWSYAVCALVAAGATFARGQGTLSLAAAGIGLALGWNTVTLAAGLRALLPAGRLGLAAGLGTGAAYALCNVPAVFTAPAAVQTWLSAGLVAVMAVALRAARPDWRESGRTPPSVSVETQGGTILPSRVAEPTGRETRATAKPAVWPWVGAFLALVWLDSAAFYVIQHTPELQAASWSGAGRLWANACVHFGAAVVAGWLLDRGALRGILGVAWVALAIGCLSLGDAAHVPVAGLVYVAGVSLYSTALVYFAALDGRPWVAATVFAVAGWVGSALGIGMAQDLHGVPWAFIAASGVWLALALTVGRLPPSGGNR